MNSKNLYRFAASLIIVSGLAGQSAIAHTQQWYLDHLDEAKNTQADCQTRVNAKQRLSDDEITECQRASTAAIRTHQYTPSKPRMW